jgi:hypothetical protein
MKITAFHPWRILLALSLSAATHAAAQVQRIRADEAPGRGIGVVVDQLDDRVFTFDTGSDRILGSVPTPGGNFPSDVVIDRGRNFAYVVKVSRVIWVIDLRDGAPRLASGVNPIAMQATGSDLALTPNQRFLIATGPSGSARLTSVVDVASRTEVFWADTGINEAVAACGDDTVLLTSQQGVVWYALDSAGALTPRAAPLQNAGYQLVAEPGGRTAVGLAPNDLVSFSSGLVEIARGSPRSGTTPIGGALAFDATGSMLFVRRQSLSGGGNLDAVGYQDGQFAPAPSWTASVQSLSASVYGNETIAVVLI